MADDEYERMRLKYGDFLDGVERQILNKENVPPEFHRYIPYAEVWGVSDDGYREQLVNRAPEEAKADVSLIIEQIDSDLDAWLAGPEADSPTPTPEYVAFSAMRMAVDFM